jgi:hypothetical protein
VEEEANKNLFLMQGPQKKQRTSLWLLPPDLVREVLRRMGDPHEYHRVARQLCRLSRVNWMPHDVRWNYLTLLTLTTTSGIKKIRWVQCAWIGNDPLRIEMCLVGLKHYLHVAVNLPIILKEYAEEVVARPGKYIEARNCVSQTQCVLFRLCSSQWRHPVLGTVGFRRLPKTETDTDCTLVGFLAHMTNVVTRDFSQ